jgi:hypothetical protein
MSCDGIDRHDREERPPKPARSQHHHYHHSPPDDRYDESAKAAANNAEWLRKQKDQAYDFAKKVNIEDAKKSATETAKKAKKWGASLLSSAKASLASAAGAVKVSCGCERETAGGVLTRGHAVITTERVDPGWRDLGHDRAPACRGRLRASVSCSLAGVGRDHGDEAHPLPVRRGRARRADRTARVPST